MFSPKERGHKKEKDANLRRIIGQILHGSATTTAAVLRAIQHSQESLRTLAPRHDINLKTVAKWRKRHSVEDAPMGPPPSSTILISEQEAVLVAFRKHTHSCRSRTAFMPCRHPFDRVRLRNGIEHRLTKPNHPWTNGQVERMNRTIKEATVKTYHYDSHEQLGHNQLIIKVGPVGLEPTTKGL